MKYVLGIDIGTTNTKSALFDEGVNLVDLEHQNYGICHPRQDWVEQTAEDWWLALVHTVRTLMDRNECRNDVVALALSTQGGSLVLLDEQFRSIRPAISWMDSRAKETAQLLSQKITADEIYRMTGWGLCTGLVFPLLFWLNSKTPEIVNKTRYVASTIDYINALLSEKFCIDYTNLAMTEFLDIHNKDYWQQAVDLTGIRRDQLPRIVPSGKVIGRLTKKAAAQLGLTEKVLLVSGAHDQYCASLGAGAVRIGDCVLSAGTAWALLATCDRLVFVDRPSASSSQTAYPGVHAIDGKFGLMTSVPFGGSSLNWFRNTFRADCSFEQIDKEARTSTPGSGGLRFIPVFQTGTGKGAFHGLDPAHTMADFTRAVYEGVALANRENFELIGNLGIRINRLLMIGGGAGSVVWPQIVADLCQTPVFLPAMREAACTGAAILAGVGGGLYPSYAEAVVRAVTECREILPDDSRQSTYDEIYSHYRLMKNKL